MVSPDGEYSELHAPISHEAAYELTAHRRQVPVQLEPETDENGIPAPHQRVEKVRARLSSFYFGDVVQKPTTHELELAQHGHGDGHADVPAEDQPALETAGEERSVER
jgi:ubiquinol-cytochrome c reductase cytochrome b subunit